MFVAMVQTESIVGPQPVDTLGFVIVKVEDQVFLVLYDKKLIVSNIIGQSLRSVSDVEPLLCWTYTILKLGKTITECFKSIVIASARLEWII